MRTHNRPRTLIGLPLIPLLLGGLSISTAQSQENKASGMLEEVVVTARRTAENLQDVPIAIAAMSSKDMQREQINSPTDCKAGCLR